MKSKQQISEITEVEPICKFCICIHSEYDGDYGEIFCGTFCVRKDPTQAGDGNHNENGTCDDWYPDFWHSRFTNLIVGGENKEVLSAIEKMHEAIKQLPDDTIH